MPKPELIIISSENIASQTGELGIESISMPSPEMRTWLSRDHRGKKVFVVGGDLVGRQEIYSSLTLGRAQVYSYNTPNIALKEIPNIQPDIILLGDSIPQMDGLTFLQAVLAMFPSEYS